MATKNLVVFIKMELRHACTEYRCEGCGRAIPRGRQYWNLGATKKRGKMARSKINRYHKECKPKFTEV